MLAFEKPLERLLKAFGEPLKAFSRPSKAFALSIVFISGISIGQLGLLQSPRKSDDNIADHQLHIQSIKPLQHVFIWIGLGMGSFGSPSLPTSFAQFLLVFALAPWFTLKPLQDLLQQSQIWDCNCGCHWRPLLMFVMVFSLS